MAVAYEFGGEDAMPSEAKCHTIRTAPPELSEKPETGRTHAFPIARWTPLCSISGEMGPDLRDRWWWSPLSALDPAGPPASPPALPSGIVLKTGPDRRLNRKKPEPELHLVL
jgi:hypothetical protein